MKERCLREDFLASTAIAARGEGAQARGECRVEIDDAGCGEPRAKAKSLGAVSTAGRRRRARAIAAWSVSAFHGTCVPGLGQVSRVVRVEVSRNVHDGKISGLSGSVSGRD